MSNEKKRRATLGPHATVTSSNAPSMAFDENSKLIISEDADQTKNLDKSTITKKSLHTSQARRKSCYQRSKEWLNKKLNVSR